MNQPLPGYDVWKLASPLECPPCSNCGHLYEDHHDIGYSTDTCDATDKCTCTVYSDEPPERDPDWKHDREREE